MRKSHGPKKKDILAYAHDFTHQEMIPIDSMSLEKKEEMKSLALKNV